MLKNIKILLKADWQGWGNSLKRGGETWRKGVLKGIGYFIFIVALSVLGNSLFSHLRYTEAKPALLLGVINGFMAFGIIVVAKELMESSLKSLYETPDTALLHAVPMHPVAIFGYKFVHLTMTRLLSMLCFLGPPWVVFGLVFGLPWHFYVALFPTCLCLLVIIASYVTISVMLIARFFSSGWLLATLKVLGTAIGVGVGFLLSLTLFTTSDLVPVKQLLLDWVSSETAGAAAKWYPHEWIGEFLLTWTTESTIGLRLRWALGGIGGCLVSVGVATLVAQLIYQRGWENIRQLKAKRKPIRSNGDSKASRLKGVAIAIGRGKIRTMMLKDFLIFVRHSGRLIATVMLTLFLAVHIGILFARGEGTDANAAEILTVQVVLYSILITFGISCNGLRDEAKTWWMLKSAPVTPDLVFTSKFLTTLLCALVYAEFWSLVIIYLLQMPRDVWMPILLTPVIMLPAGCALNTAIGTLPWMAELTHQPKPLLRVVTFTVVLIVNIGLVIAPVIAWYTKSIVLFVGLIVSLASIFVVSYKWGIGNLRKLLVAQQ
ncbi:hypothetical protein F4Z99_00685 [Candidatus Poribacteria bacterium]|nr:hypothetical protein [Candidatus Poribacteria bacterium]MYB01922.1 hypothetical protein [Candidatus Poribacteria bacterium]